jgi:hypothetical protein
MRNTTNTQGVLLRLSLLAAAFSLLPLAGCNDPLRVTDPDILTPGQLDDPATLPTIRAGALGDFSLAYSGDGSDGSGGVEGVIMYGGLLADEWINSETFPTRIEVDARRTQVTNADLDLWFRTLSRARRSVENAAGRFAALAPTEPGYPEMLSLSGFAYLFFAENFCSGIPVSQAAPDGTLSYGDPLTTTQLLDSAIARFDSALAVSGDPDMTSLASVGPWSIGAAGPPRRRLSRPCRRRSATCSSTPRTPTVRTTACSRRTSPISAIRSRTSKVATGSRS